MSILTTVSQNNHSIDFSDSIYNLHYLKKDNEVHQLKEAILLAISLDEDVFLFTKDAQSLPRYTFDEISDVIIDLVTNEINMLLVDVDSSYHVRFNEFLQYVEDINTVRSFFLTRPLYAIVLALIEHKEEYGCDSILKLVQLINPYNFKLVNGSFFQIQQQKINIISPFRNAAEYLSDYLDSIRKQQYDNYVVHLIDDQSDISYDISDKINYKINLTVNKDRKFALQNIVDNLMNSNYCDEDIICFVDADDILLHNHVFEILNAVYSSNPTISMTYGAMTYLNSDFVRKTSSKYSQEEFVSIRKSPWRVAHLRTFKYKLFKELLAVDPQLDCLSDEYGNIFKMPYDMAILFPFMELAGYDGVKFLNTPLYGYRMHENNDHVLYRKIQYESEMKIRNKPSLKAITANS